MPTSTPLIAAGRPFPVLLALITLLVTVTIAPNRLSAQGIPPAIKDRLTRLAKRMDEGNESGNAKAMLERILDGAPSERAKMSALDFLDSKTSTKAAKSLLEEFRKVMKPVAPKRRFKSRGKSYALTNVTILDGKNRAQPDMIMIFDEEKIVKILSKSESDKIPEGVEKVDMAGAFITPGLIDVHVHMATNPSSPSEKPAIAMRNLRRMIGGGITSVRDMGGDGRVLTFYARQMKLGDEIGPDIYFSTILAGPRFFTDRRVRAASQGATLGAGAWAHEVDDNTDLSALMQRVKGIGSTGVKLYYDIDQELATKIAKEAKKAGIEVWSHWRITPSTEMETVEAGIEVVSHASFIGRAPKGKRNPRERKVQTIPEILQSSNLDLIFRRMKDKGTIFDPTLAVIAARNRKIGKAPSPLEISGAVVMKAEQMGVKIAAGSDSHGDNQVSGGHIEFRLLNQVGKMSPQSVLHSATVVNAEVLGQGESIGQLAVGKQSTFLIYDTDPMKSVKSWAEPKFVVKRGVIYSGEQLRDLDSEVEPLTNFKK